MTAMESDKSRIERLRAIVETLQNEHSEGVKHVQELAEAAHTIQRNGFNAAAFEQIARSIRWINTGVRMHMQAEEQHLFPAIRAENPRLFEQLHSEHRELGTAFTQLMNTVFDVEEGTLRGSILQELVTTTDNVVRLLEKHMQEENAALFPLLQNMLNASSET